MAKGSGTTKSVGSGFAASSRTTNTASNPVSNFNSFKNGEKVNIGGIQFTHSIIPKEGSYPEHSFFEGRLVTDTGTYNVFMNGQSDTKAEISIQKVGFGDLWSQVHEVTISTSGMSTLRDKVMNAINEYSKNPTQRLSNPQKFFGSGGSSSSSSVSAKHITANSSSFFKKK